MQCVRGAAPAKLPTLVILPCVTWCAAYRIKLRWRELPETVMSVYLVAQINIHDRDRYAQYEAGFMDVFAQYGGEILAIDEAPAVLEGQWSCTRTVLIRFADDAAARA